MVPLWFSLLFLPFKGLKASLILFCVLFGAALLFIFLRGSAKSLGERMSAWVTGIGELRRSAALSRTVRYVLPLAVISFPFFGADYFLDVAVLAGIYVILALALNVVVGFTGLLNLGFVAFYAIGAYAYALLNMKLGLNFWEALPLCLALTTGAGFALSVPALRLRGDYLAIVTLGFGEITHLVLNNWDSLTNGPNGVNGISPPSFFGFSLGSLNRYYYLIVLAAISAYIVIKRIRISRLGRAWIAIREDEIGASSVGINVTRYKLYSTAFGAFWAGAAGVLFAAKMRFVSPESFTFMESVLILCMVILGGIGSIGGVVIGAVILVALPEILREVQTYRMLALGVGLIIMMIFRPQGLFGGARTK